MAPMKIFGLNASKEYAQLVAKHLGTTLTPHEEKLFADGESYVKAADGDIGNVRGHQVFVIQSLYDDNAESVSDKFMKLAIFCASLRTASAASICAVIPHLAWARQDRKTESRAPVTTKAVAVMLEAVGVDRLLFMDVHNLSAEQNAFSLRCPMDNLECKNLHVDWCLNNLTLNGKVVGLSDDGGYKRLTRFCNALSKRLGFKVTTAVLDKVRYQDIVTGGDRIVGDVQDASVIIYDDMISTGSTTRKAYDAAVKYGGEVVAVMATHGLFVGKANEYLDGMDTKIVVADTVSPFRLNAKNRAKVDVIDTSAMMADAIRRISSGTGSISELLR